MNKEEIKNLWKELEDATFYEDDDGNLYLGADWFIFKKGTIQTEIWSWFNKNYEGGIYKLIYDVEKERRI